ncbi:MAG: TonB-dependent receptor [Saprospiraceae bacterium]|nr:TonB-dependent receptor [Saprospiraceae bacterium]
MKQTIHRSWLVIASLIASFPLLGQTITVESAVTRDALIGASITDPSFAHAMVTDNRGQADISPFRSSDTLIISYLGHDTRHILYSDLEQMEFKIHLQESSILLGTVPVTATRWSQPMKRSAQALAVIRPGEVRLQNPQTAADLLGLSGQVFIQKSQLGGGSPMIRGFAANRVLISVDGVRMNTAIFRSGNLQNVIALDPLTLDQTEIILGPGSLLYGSDAIGGVMLFTTRQPTLIPAGDSPLRGQAFMRFASASQEKTIHLDLHYGKGKWAFLTSATHTDYDDLRMGRHGPDEYLRPSYVQRLESRDTVITNADPTLQIGSGYRQFNVMQKIRFMPNDQWDIEYGFHLSTTGDVPRYDRLIRPKGNTLRSAEWTYGPQNWQMHHLEAEHKADSPLFDHLRLALAYQYSGESRQDRDLNKPIRYIREEAVDAWSLNIDLHRSIDDKQTLSYGLEGVFNTVSSSGTDENITTGIAVPGPSRYPDGSTWSSWGGYALYQYHPREAWVLEGGLRYNYITLDAAFDPTFYALPFATARQRNGGLTGNAGVTWQSTSGWQVSAMGSTGFRSPNIDDVGKVFDSTPGSVVVPYPDIRPEYAWSANLGLARTFGERLKVDLNAWYTLLDDALVRRDFTLNGLDSILYDGELSRVQALQNAAQAKVWGIQGGLEAVLPYGFKLRWRGSWQKGEEELEDGSTAPLRHAAPWTTMAQLQYRRTAWQFDLTWQYQATVENQDLAPDEQGKDYLYAKDKDGLPYAPPWSILHLKALWQVREYISLSGGIENILDVRYRPYSSGISAPGRNVIVGLRIGF